MCIKQNIYKHVWKMILYCPNWMGRSANEDDTDYMGSHVFYTSLIIYFVRSVWRMQLQSMWYRRYL